MKHFPLEETTFLLKGPIGAIETLVSPILENPRDTVAIICHPHPLFGGTMNNKVVTTLARTFHELNIATVRFNFRGVGKTEGTFAEGIGETEDLLAIIQWVKEVCPGKVIWLAGFSFGGFVAARAATRISVEQLVTVAPQVSRFIEVSLPPITCPWILIQGDKDEVVSAAEVYAWIDTLQIKPHLIHIAEAGHFFHGKLVELREKLTLALEKSN